MQVLSETLRLSSFTQWLPKEANNDIYINSAFFFRPLTCVLSFCFQNLPLYLTWIGKYDPVYIACHEVVDMIQGEEGVEGVYGFACWTSWSTFFQRPIRASTLLV